MEQSSQERKERVYDQYLKEKRINDLEEQVQELYKVCRTLANELQVLKSQPNTNPEGGIYKVKNIFFNKEYEYAGSTINRFVVELEGHPTPYIMDRKKKNTNIVQYNDMIMCRIDGDKLRDVEILYEQ